MRKRVTGTGIMVLVFFLVLGVLVSIRLTGLGSQFPNPIGGVLQRVLSPVEGVILRAGNSLKDNTRVFWNFGDVQKENEELRTRVEQLTGDNLKLKEQVLAGLRYNELDSKMFKSPDVDKYTKIGASIISRNPNAWYQTLTINRGTNDGVAVDDPVIVALGLVGKIVSVTPTTSEVLLITDSEGQVSALVRGSTGSPTFGIVEGTYKRTSRLEAEGNLQMLLRRDDNVNVGDLVLTSGLGGVYPKDIPVGKVEQIQLDGSGLLKTAYISPLVNFDSLEEIYIIEKSGGQ
ncbi:rod shape-determining protein MreC [Desulfitobacterium sp. LBE]|uniref:Cell shape-determining protein MreC n=3 Tax=root TaxID=1 RepID=A0A098B361_DESHA|nr:MULTISPECIES: rod shape-determining protein MreC [Desulfitobacterium]ACL22355.1 rod shape-determining protein MreC [Desulfitobacterium hafniense DCB-2]MEA5021459.1 rod shape-determining protein MreC [Desulfitobacterium hafniense]TWH59870.1 rod shape-determining protein MreC [Desulfitobacterium sp. LBE]CDX03288.1 Cell shape-determining protein MreC [Desulfitobacterium hafniense]